MASELVETKLAFIAGSLYGASENSYDNRILKENYELLELNKDNIKLEELFKDFSKYDKSLYFMLYFRNLLTFKCHNNIEELISYLRILFDRYKLIKFMEGRVFQGIKLNIIYKILMENTFLDISNNEKDSIFNGFVNFTNDFKSKNIDYKQVYSLIENMFFEYKDDAEECPFEWYMELNWEEFFNGKVY